MKRTNAPPIPEGLRIELNGEQEWQDVMQVFEDAGWKWINGDKPTDVIEAYCNDDMYLPVVITERFSQLSRGGSSGYNEITAAQFLQQYQGTIEYEEGDWVVLLKSQGGDPVGTITQITKVIGTSVNVKNVTRQPLSVEYAWSATIDSIRPATPEEIASVTKVKPVAVKKPEPHIWDGDVLPDEYWVENPWPNEGNTEFVELFDTMRVGNGIAGVHRWYHVKNSKRIDSHNYSNTNTELPIVPYELWKKILTTPDNQIAQLAVKERMFKKGDRVKVVTGSYERCLGTVDDLGVDSLYWIALDSGDKSWFFSGETGTSVDIVHYTEEPAVERWSIVTTDGVTVYAGSSIWWAKQGIIENHWAEEKWAIENAKAGWFSFSTFEAAEEYISKQKQPAGRKWKVGDRYCNPADMADDVDIPNTEGWYIRQVSRDNYKMETVDGEDKMSRYSYTAKQIDNYIKRGDWIPYSENKEKEDNTIISKQTKNQTTNNGNNKQQSQQDSYSSNINNQSSGYSGTAFDLRADQETVSAGSRSTGTSLRCSGQSELFAVKHSGYPKGSGYCEEV